MNKLKAEEAAYVLGIAEEGIFGKIKDKIKSKFGKKSEKPVDSTKTISREEFDRIYKKEFEYARKALIDAVKKASRDPELKLVAKAYTVATSDDDDSLTSQLVLYRDYWKCGNARQLCGEDEFIDASNAMYDRFSDCVGPGTKAPHLKWEDGGDWDDGMIEIYLEGIEVED